MGAWGPEYRLARGRRNPSGAPASHSCLIINHHHHHHLIYILYSPDIKVVCSSPSPCAPVATSPCWTLSSSCTESAWAACSSSPRSWGRSSGPPPSYQPSVRNTGSSINAGAWIREKTNIGCTENKVSEKRLVWAATHSQGWVGTSASFSLLLLLYRFICILIPPIVYIFTPLWLHWRKKKKKKKRGKDESIDEMH